MRRVLKKLDSYEYEKIRWVELDAQIKMIAMDVTRGEAHWWVRFFLTYKPPPGKSGLYVKKSDSELTPDEKEKIEICKLLEGERCDKSAKEEEQEEDEYQNLLALGKKDCYIVFRKDLDCAIWVLKDITEYNRVNELQEFVEYCSRPLSAYGYDLKMHTWNTKLFPTTQTDAQIEGIKSDRDKFRKAVADYYEYVEYLARKYHVDLAEANKYNDIIFYHVPKLKVKKRKSNAN